MTYYLGLGLILIVSGYVIYFLRHDNYEKPDPAADFWASLNDDDQQWLDINGVEVLKEDQQ